MTLALVSELNDLTARLDQIDAKRKITSDAFRVLELDQEWVELAHELDVLEGREVRA